MITAGVINPRIIRLSVVNPNALKAKGVRRSSGCVSSGIVMVADPNWIKTSNVNTKGIEAISRLRLLHNLIFRCIALSIAVSTPMLCIFVNQLI